MRTRMSRVSASCVEGVQTLVADYAGVAFDVMEIPEDIVDKLTAGKRIFLEFKE